MMKAVARAAIAFAALGMAGAAFAGDDGSARIERRTYKFEWKAPFADMSPQGMALIGEAMKRERIPANAEEVRKARQRVLELLSAERLDIGAIRRAQAEERAVAITEHALAQEKMLKAYQQLSVEDRRAFAEGMRMQEERMTKHMARARERMQQVQEQMRREQNDMRREMERMRREVERVKKETGGLWIVVPPAPPAAEERG